VHFQNCYVKSVICSNRTIENTFVKTTDEAELFFDAHDFKLIWPFPATGSQNVNSERGKPTSNTLNRFPSSME